jgi:hypothetical protein
MKKISLLLLWFGLNTMTYAYDTAKLTLQLEGAIQSNHFLCINNTGCYATHTADKGHVFAMELRTIDSLAVLDVKKNRVQAQALPASCRVAVLKDQTLVISGKMNQMEIDDLKCRVVG